MNLQWFIDNTSNKVIRIDSVNTQGEIGMQTELTVKDAEINKTLWHGFRLIINEEINLYFDKYKISQYDDCKNVLNLYRNDEWLISICLPFEDSWTDAYIKGYARY